MKVNESAAMEAVEKAEAREKARTKPSVQGQDGEVVWENAHDNVLRLHQRSAAASQLVDLHHIDGGVAAPF